MGANAYNAMTVARQPARLAYLEEEVHAPLWPSHPTVARRERAGAAKRVFELAEEVVEPNRVGNTFRGGRLHLRSRTLAAKALTHS